jgi:hydrogenase maturation protease
MNSAGQTLILGIGNLLMGDEGVGVHAIRHIQQEQWPDNVRLLDGGTGGFHLLSLFKEYDPIVLIDATMDGKQPGTVTITKPRFASDFPRTLTAHDIGLRDLLESATLLGPLPELYLVAVTIGEIRSMEMELSQALCASLPRIAEALRGIVGTGSQQ